MQNRKKKLKVKAKVKATPLSKAVQKEEEKRDSTRAQAIMRASLHAAKVYNLKHLHPEKLAAARRAKEKRQKQIVAFKKAQKLQERKKLFAQLSKSFTKKKQKVKKIKRAPKVAKKALKKKKRVVKMLRTNVFSSEVVDTHIHKHNPSPVDEFLGDIGVGPKVKKQAAPVPKGVPNAAFVTKTMDELINGNEHTHKEKKHDRVSHVSRPVVGSLHVSEPAPTVRTQKKVSHQKKVSVKKKARPTPVLGSTAALIASLKKAGMTKEASELEKTANGGVASLVSPKKKKKKVQALQPKVPLVQPLPSHDDVLIEQLKAAGMTKQANALATQLKSVTP